ncbi:MAG: DUF2075 domain-containing protein [Pseudomonadota bacterium]|nr:DUF2075 domain-containing protein [Pseudomonadota bacterium]
MPTGIPGMDQILNGGLLKGSIYLVQGSAGAGKTILANQISFNWAAAGRKATYITLLSESHARMLQHMEMFSFYQENAIPRALRYISAFDGLAREGLPGLMGVLTHEMHERKVDLLVLDGLVTAAGASGSAQELKLFIAQIQAMSALTGCTVLLLNSVSASAAHSTPEQTMVDGIIMLRQQVVRSRHERTVEIVKFRGSSVVHAAHTFRIGSQGIVLFPQLETVLGRGPVAPINARVSTGVPGLDAMIHGGYPIGSTTAITGPEGSGKSLAGLQFLSQASAREPALLFAFEESIDAAEAVGETFGLNLRSLVGDGLLHLWGRPTLGSSESLDEVGYRLLTAVKSTGARRVFVDGLGSLFATAAYEQRGAAFFAALFKELRRAGATSLFSVRLGHDGSAPVLAGEVSPLMDNVVRLSVSEQHQKLVRSVSIGKVQVSLQDLSIRELELTTSGLRVQRPVDEEGAPT